MKLSSIIVSFVVAAAAITSFQVAAGVTKIKASNNYVTEKRQITSIREIVSKTSIDVVYRQSQNKAIEVYAPDNVIKYIRTSVKGNVLTVDYDSNIKVVGINLKIKVSVWAPKVEVLKTSGSGDVVIASNVWGNKMALGSSGSGDIKSLFKIHVDELNVGTSGSGDVELGKMITKTTNCASTGSGDIEIDALEANDVRLASAGSGDIKVKGKADKGGFASAGSGDMSLTNLRVDDVNVSCTGSGDVSCYAVRSVNIVNRGAGDVKWIGPANKVNCVGDNIQHK